MPSSHTYQINEIMELIILTEPKSILDVGCGFGKFGLLCYERLNLWYTDDINNKKVKIDAIEAFSKYLTPVHSFVYDKIYIGEALEALGNIKQDEKYDLVLLVDVFEHFEREAGIKLLFELEKRCRNIIISVPKDIGSQGAVFGNKYEVHRTGWTPEDFREMGSFLLIPNRFSWIVYMGENLLKIKKQSYYLRGRK